MNASLRRRLAIGFGVLALTGTASAVANPAYADGTFPDPFGNIPNTGELCTATENIKFFGDDGITRYVVLDGEFIRIDDSNNGSPEKFVYGHGEDHLTQMFFWQHTDGRYRLAGCH